MITANPYQPPNVDAAMPVIDEQRRRARHLLRGVLIWFLALPLLESVAAWIRWAGARQVDVDRWNRALYRSLNPAIYLAMAGALLWTVWVIGFYFLGVDFTVISWLVGVPAHLLAACLYLPLLYRWYRLAQSDGEDESSPTKPTDSLSKS